MTTFHLEIATDSAAFCDFDGNPDEASARAEVSRILSVVQSRLRDGEFTGSLRDWNGNGVGQFWTEEDEGDDAGQPEPAVLDVPGVERP